CISISQCTSERSTGFFVFDPPTTYAQSPMWPPRSCDDTASISSKCRPHCLEDITVRLLFPLTAVVAIALTSACGGGRETVDTRIGSLAFESGYPSQETVTKLYDEMDFQRACQAYLWGIPAVGMAEWRLAHRDIMKAKNGEMLSYLTFQEKLGIL